MSEQSADAQGPQAPPESPPDAQLIADLRDGDVEAYEELWLRHIGPALRMARRLAPHHAEDLVAESFTVVLHQVTVAGGGPEQSFRAYLFTVMRNLAIRWNREGRRLLPVSALDDPTVEDSADRVLADEDARIVLRALRTLPARWQQVLWLTEVDDVPRPAIAAQFGMSPNAVSALLRRARHGLRHSCLTEHVPESLRGDSGHVARVLPDLVTGKLAPDVVVKVTSHLATCDTCREVHHDLRGLSRRVKRATLGTLGFGALTLLARNLRAAEVTTVATTALAAGAVGGRSLSTAVKVAAVAAGVIMVAGPIASSLWSPSELVPAAAAAPSPSTAPSPSVSGWSPRPAVPQTTRTADPGIPVTPDPTTTQSLTGSDIPVVNVRHQTGTGVAPRGPRPDPIDPGPVPGSTTPSSPSGPASSSPKVGAPTTPAPTRSESPSYRPDPSDPTPAGVVLISDPPLPAPTVDGLPSERTMNQIDAELDGIVITITAPGQQTACLSVSTGQRATIPLNADGIAKRRIRFVGIGTFELSVTICDGERHGPPTLGRITVYTDEHDPWLELEPDIIVEEP